MGSGEMDSGGWTAGAGSRLDEAVAVTDAGAVTTDLEPEARLVREWAACGIVAAVSRFVPVPLLDDVVKERATRLALSRTLTAAGRELPVTQLEVLYTGADGWFAGVRKYAVGIPGRVVLFPVRKYVAVFGAVKGVPSDVMAVLLLARTLHRALGRGGFTGSDPKALRREAKQLRRAYETAFDEMDLRLLSGALGDVLSTSRALSGAAAVRAQHLMDRIPGRRQESDPEIERSADDVQRVLRRPEISALIHEFDRRVDAYLGFT
jgi:hypothetical protein